MPDRSPRRLRRALPMVAAAAAGLLAGAGIAGSEPAPDASTSTQTNTRVVRVTNTVTRVRVKTKTVPTTTTVTTTTATPVGGEGGSSGCSPDYTGACVPADAGDVNCADIPDQDFSSIGSDPYGLDRDGDGIACES